MATWRRQGPWHGSTARWAPHGHASSSPLLLTPPYPCLDPSLHRQAPLNAIWEGSGNVICLDVLRALQREPAALRAFLAEVHRFQGADQR